MFLSQQLVESSHQYVVNHNNSVDRVSDRSRPPAASSMAAEARPPYSRPLYDTSASLNDRPRDQTGFASTQQKGPGMDTNRDPTSVLDDYADALMMAGPSSGPPRGADVPDYNGRPYGADIVGAGRARGDARGGDPRRGDPRGGDPRGADPRGGDPRGGDRRGGPRGGDPRDGDLGRGDPRGGPRDGGLRGGDPWGGGPRDGDPRGGGPRVGDPRGGDPRGGDPRGGGPRVGDPTVAHHRDGDMRRGDFRGGDPMGGDPRDGGPREPAHNGYDNRWHERQNDDRVNDDNVSHPRRRQQQQQPRHYHFQQPHTLQQQPRQPLQQHSSRPDTEGSVPSHYLQPQQMVGVPRHAHDEDRCRTWPALHYDTLLSCTFVKLPIGYLPSLFLSVFTFTSTPNLNGCLQNNNWASESKGFSVGPDPRTAADAPGLRSSSSYPRYDHQRG